MKTKIILISGKQGVGKSSLQEELYNRLPMSTKFRFADPLYQIHEGIQQMMHWIYPEITCAHRKIAKDGPLLQMLGTNWARAFDNDIWVKIAQRKVGELLRKGFAPIIIDDCRFKNEFHAFDDMGVLKIRLHCDKDIRKARCTMWRDNDTHPSEIDLDEYAAEGKFDLHYDTENFDIEALGDRVLQALE